MLMIGCGRMGASLLAQWRSTHAWRGPVLVVKPTPSLPEALASDRQVRVIERVADTPPGYAPAIVVLAVKPQQMMGVLADCARHLPPDCLYLTIAAGLRLDAYRKMLGPDARLVRAMPNSPARIGMAMTLLAAAPGSDERDADLTEALMKAVGEVVWLPDESRMDAATAIAGSGPAYVFYFMESLISAAIDAGIDPKIARLLVVQTFQGSSELAYLSGEALADLRTEVTSRGGTTEAALDKLMHPGGMLDLVHSAVEAAIRRATEIAASAQ